ncbi:chloramphenicol O-acetyltransferase type A [Pontibacter ummariensis]|uniref:Chloramphenicol O-acetyltransferase type A n=1 Tax=Pontibacter ummariensis TaxID=1610492 RepID=A0A239KU66_9BACT|nr:chloramphenicol acetyltransferase [Pontibacter ummariensis]PRY05018.1 chloramphenicol O-acetyltransferase type A [Pontibacter ummariensis]SNT21208.1 chloramphenicol O-acetyltransferase type A [Pontibacter ummariensis]
MMKKEINISDWNRKDHYLFFSQFEEPFFGITIQIDCTKAYEQVKKNNQSFFLYYLYRALQAANTVEAFRYRTINGKVYVFEQVNASSTISRADHTFGFAYMDYEEDEGNFYEKANEIIKGVQQSEGLIPAVSGKNVIHFSAIPWMEFTSISHARSFTFSDSCPKVSFGKVTEKRGVRTMPVSVHVHHGLADGYHVGLFVEEFQRLMNDN